MAICCGTEISSPRCLEEDDASCLFSKHTPRIINRRGYGKTTPLPKDQYPAPEKDSANVVITIGLDILEFIHTFSRKEQLPFTDTQGGFILLFWSLGNMNGLSAVANIANASEEIKATMTHLKGLILHEAPQVALGLPSPQTPIYPDVLQLLPPTERHSFLLLWLSAYFDHDSEALEAKSVSTPDLIYASPSPLTPPSIYNISGREERVRIFQESGGVDMDFVFMLFTNREKINENYKKAVFGSGLKEKTIFVISDRTPAQLLITSWQAEANGIKMLHLKGGNHFAQWDFPEETLKAYLTVVGSMQYLEGPSEMYTSS